MDLDDIIAAVREELELLKRVIQKVEALSATGPTKSGGRPKGIVDVGKPRKKRQQGRAKCTNGKMPG